MGILKPRPGSATATTFPHLVMMPLSLSLMVYQLPIKQITAINVNIARKPHTVTNLMDISFFIVILIHPVFNKNTYI